MPDSTPKRPRGRPPKPPEEVKVIYGHRMSREAHAWIKANKEKIEQMARQ